MNDGFDSQRKNHQPNNFSSNKCKVNYDTHPATKATSNIESLDYQNYILDNSFVHPFNNDTIPNTNQVNISYLPNNKKVNNRSIHSKNLSLTAQNPARYFENQRCHDYSSSDGFQNTFDTEKLFRNELIYENSFDDPLKFQKTLQASAKCFVPTTKITEEKQNLDQPNRFTIDSIENDVGVCLSEPAKNFIKQDLQISLSINNGTRPKEICLNRKFDKSNQLSAHSKDMKITNKKAPGHYDSYRQKTNDNYFRYESSNTKNQHNNWNYYDDRSFERGSERCKPPSHKKLEWKNSAHNRYQSIPHHNNERYDPNQQKSNYSERGRFNTRSKSHGNNYNGQNSANVDYVYNYYEHFNHDRQEPSYQNKTVFRNNKENCYNGNDKNIIPRSNKKFERNNKFVKPKMNTNQSNYHASGPNLYLQTSDERKISKTLKTKYNSKEDPVSNNISQSSIILDGRTQRETLIDLLSQGLFECMVCCERIKQSQAIWSCTKCYNCFHLGCTKKWAGASQGDPGWRCPACQNLNAKVPSGYYCFCKKMRDPEWNRREIAHSCGEVCALKRENEWCTHKCTDLCHPGPCPDCSAFVKRLCGCGKNTKEMRCSVTEPYLCGEKCLKRLTCGVHFCQLTCHTESCETCTEIIEKKCYCGKETETTLCTVETSSEPSFSCNNICNMVLSCSYHTCQSICHSGSCAPCDKSPDVVKSCPCGMVNLNSYYEEKGISPRSLCTDPIPTCSNICNKILKCGTPGSYHKCQSQCHTGLCPPCPKLTVVKCRCGFMDTNIPCSELLSKADEVICERQCKRLRQCGKHKCGVKCCIDIDHVCDRICSRTLKCRLHKCQEPCHRGNCPRCWETSFDELSCHCGASVIYPPVPCGTEAPSCNLPCRRQQSCSHSVSHNCHADPKCPPCTTLVSKSCFGNHTIMKSTPCYVNGMSCGDLCGKMLPCKIHKCQKVCHDGSCVKGSKCNQNCTERRSSCEHACNNTCHIGPCPNNPCKETVSVTCICGNRRVDMICSENDKEYKSLATSKLASMMHNMNNGVSVDLSHLFSGSNKVEKFQRLECNEECGLIARNRRLALALQITNPDSRELLGENNLFPESMKEEARKDMQFAKMVHNTLNDLVLKAKESKQKNRSHSFAPMNRDKRRFIHEYSKFFACQSQSYDEEPKKNVVVTACKLMSRLPPISLVSVIQKELGQRKVPGPVMPRKNVSCDEAPNSMKKLEKSSSFEKKEAFGKTTGSDNLSVSSDVSEKKPPTIDYFDFS